MKKIKLVLENGDEYIGESIGHEINDSYYIGELVFNTSMTGYQEIISDPSYCDQIIVMTYPLIGNYGASKNEFECLTPALKGLVVSECLVQKNHLRNEHSLRDILYQFKIPGIAGIDTRELAKKIRSRGVMKSALAPEDYPIQLILSSLQSPMLKDQIKRVSIKSPLHYPGDGERIVLIDFGYKKSILKSLLKRKCDVIIVPWNSSADLIRTYQPDGIVLSNGPGNPQDIPEVLSVIREIQVEFPMFCICMGHQLFALANGAETKKLKFGHRGSNHPVKDLKQNRVFMTSQNHGYSVIPSSIENTALEITQININDKSIEGLSHKYLPAFSVQYHPEGHPGPEDTTWLFDDFLNTIRNKNANRFKH